MDDCGKNGELAMAKVTGMFTWMRRAQIRIPLSWKDGGNDDDDEENSSDNDDGWDNHDIGFSLGGFAWDDSSSDKVGLDDFNLDVNEC